MRCSWCAQRRLAHRQAYLRKVLQDLVCISFRTLDFAHRVDSMVDAYHGESVISGLVPSKYGSLYHLFVI